MNSAAQLTRALAGRYEIEREIGAGGMATVYLARDVKHQRRVAVKVLHPDLAAALGAERFLAEIRTTANLQHPHILPLHDSGEADGLLFYVMPFVEGETLRARLERERVLPIADAVRIAREVLSALDYAHRHGVIHRDIKPENVLLHDGSALVADFGIALAVQTAGGQRMTQTGLSLGTPSYMSPEQAMGEKHIDARTDVYAVGAMLYEMLTGDPPFTGSTIQAIVAKVMTERPTPPSVTRDTVPTNVEQAVLTALAKLAADRFATAAEFADALQKPATTATLGAAAATPKPGSRRPRMLAAIAIATVVALAFLVGRFLHTPATSARFTQKTFDGEYIVAARFAPDGKTIVITTDSEDVRVIRPDYPEPQSLGIGKAWLLAVSSKGELALLTNPTHINNASAVGTLARMPLGGGAPRQLVANVTAADWSPDGSQLAIVRSIGTRQRLEYPIGKPLYETAGQITDVRVSPDGKLVAFADHPILRDTRGTIAVVDLGGKKTTLTREFSGTLGLAWSPDGNELYFTARENTHQMVVFAASMKGALREALNGPGDLTVYDVAKDGQWLVTRDVHTQRVLARGSSDSVATIVASWLDYAWMAIVSADGRQLAVSDAGNESGENYSVWLRSSAGGRLARIGEGWPRGFTTDGSAVLAVVPAQPARLMLYPTGAGNERQVPTPFANIDDAGWVVADSSVYVCGHAADEISRCVVEGIDGAQARNSAAFASAIAHQVPGAKSPVHVSPNGRFVAFSDSAGFTVTDIATGATKKFVRLPGDGALVRWSPDGRALWLLSGKSPALQQMDATSGSRTKLIAELLPAGSSVPGHLFSFSDDHRTYAFVQEVMASDLFLVSGAH